MIPFRATIFILITIIIIGCFSGRMDENVQMVKGSMFESRANKTIGEAIDGFFQNPKWSSGVSQEGITFVNAEGNFLFMEKKVKGLIQFKFSSDKRNFEINAFEINEVPQNRLILNALLEKMYNN